MASTWVTAQDKLLEKHVADNGGCMTVALLRPRFMQRKREQFLKSFQYPRGKFTFYSRRLYVGMRPWDRVTSYLLPKARRW